MNKRIKGSSLIERSFVLPHPCLPWGQAGSPSQLPSAWHICHCDLPKNNQTHKGSQQLSCRCQRSPSTALCLLERPFWQGAGERWENAPAWSPRSHSEDIPTWLPACLPPWEGGVQGLPWAAECGCSRGSGWGHHGQAALGQLCPVQLLAVPAVPSPVSTTCLLAQGAAGLCAFQMEKGCLWWPL